MSASRYVSDAEMAAFRQDLRNYNAVYPDSDFLDNAHELAESGGTFTRENAEKVRDALRNWAQRLASPTFDPDRPPPGCDPHIWKLATFYRDETEKTGRWCPSRRMIHWELARVIDRDNLTGNYEPWLDGTDPGWYRMLHDVIRVFARELPPGDIPSGYALLGELTAPGAILAIAASIRDQFKLAAFERHAAPASTRTPTPERRAAVKAFIQRRKGRH